MEIPQEGLQLPHNHEAEQSVQSTQTKDVHRLLQLVPQLEVQDLLGGPLVIPCTHLVDVGGEASVRHSEDLIGQSADEGDGLVHTLESRDGDGRGLVH